MCMRNIDLLIKENFLDLEFKVLKSNANLSKNCKIRTCVNGILYYNKALFRIVI